MHSFKTRGSGRKQKKLGLKNAQNAIPAFDTIEDKTRES
jgi:hypothetical protein